MALFGLFKSKQERDMESAFAAIQKMIFPGGDFDLDRDAARIGQLTRGKIGADKLRGFTGGCKALVHISEDYDDADFVRSFIVRSENRLSEAEAYDVYVYLAGEAFYRDSATRMWVDRSIPITQEMRTQIDEFCEKYKHGTYKDSIEGGHGDFGVTLSNPIPTVSVKGSNKYLSRIRHAGRPVEHKRVGSTSSPITQGNVDIYELSVQGRGIGTIFICPYHRRTSRIAPKGFTLA